MDNWESLPELLYLPCFALRINHEYDIDAYAIIKIIQTTPDNELDSTTN